MHTHFHQSEDTLFINRLTDPRMFRLEQHYFHSIFIKILGHKLT